MQKLKTLTAFVVHRRVPLTSLNRFVFQAARLGKGGLAAKVGTAAFSPASMPCHRRKRDLLSRTAERAIGTSALQTAQKRQKCMTAPASLPRCAPACAA
eukprot:6179741-Pleurochrysis_carterae.AAC.3